MKTTGDTMESLKKKRVICTCTECRNWPVCKAKDKLMEVIQIGYQSWTDGTGTALYKFIGQRCLLFGKLPKRKK